MLRQLFKQKSSETSLLREHKRAVKVSRFGRPMSIANGDVSLEVEFVLNTRMSALAT
jgi:hypothetical protein